MHCDDKGKKRMKKAVGSVAQKAAEGADSLLAEARQDVVDVKNPEPAVNESTEDMAEAVSKVKGSAEEMPAADSETVMQDTTKLINSFEFSGGNKKMDKQFIMESLDSVQDSAIVESKQSIAEFITDLHRTQMDEEGTPLLGQNDFKKLNAFVSEEPREAKAEGGKLDVETEEDIKRYLTLYEGLQESLSKAKSKDEQKKIYEKFKKYEDTFENETVFKALQSLDEMESREGKAFGGMLAKIVGTITEGDSSGGLFAAIKSKMQDKEASISNLEGPDPVEPSNNMPSIGYAEGGDVDEDDMPVDTYPNISEDEMDEVMASQLPDSDMENEYSNYVLEESLTGEEQDYLLEVLGKDSKLSTIFDKVMDTAGEFAGDGAVEGPGTGTSDSIPARLSDGEFVFTKKSVDVIGADELQKMMDDAERDYDEDREGKYEGGMMGSLLNGKDYDEEVHNQMLSANAMPSVQG